MFRFVLAFGNLGCGLREIIQLGIAAAMMAAVRMRTTEANFILVGLG